MSAGWKRDRRRLRRQVRETEARTSAPLLARVEAAEDERDFFCEAFPVLEEFTKHWLGSGFWRRVWNAARYVFRGDNVLREMTQVES